jgi:hypothetical protein
MRPKLGDPNKEIGTLARSVRADEKPAPTQQVKHRLVGAGFMPARMVFPTWKLLGLGDSQIGIAAERWSHL